MQDLKKRLNKDAVISLGLLSAADYWGEEAIRINSIMYNTMEKVFKNILIIPGLKNYFIASDNDLRINIPELIKQRRVETIYVNQYFIDERVLAERSSEIMNSLDRSAGINLDFSPVSYYRQLRHWLSSYRFDYKILWGIVTALLVVAVRRFNAISFGMFAAGFASTSLEVVLLLSFQVIYGYVYQMTGLIITVFMAGLAAGALSGERITGCAAHRAYALLQLFTGAAAILLPFILLAMKHILLHDYMVYIVFICFTFVISVLTGMAFSVASRLRSGSYSDISSELYGIELLGSAIGALIVTAYLIPLLGIMKVCFIIALMSIAGGAVACLDRKSSPC